MRTGLGRRAQTSGLVDLSPLFLATCCLSSHHRPSICAPISVCLWCSDTLRKDPFYPRLILDKCVPAPAPPPPSPPPFPPALVTSSTHVSASDIEALHVAEAQGSPDPCKPCNEYRNGARPTDPTFCQWEEKYPAKWICQNVPHQGCDHGHTKCANLPPASPERPPEPPARPDLKFEPLMQCASPPQTETSNCWKVVPFDDETAKSFIEQVYQSPRCAASHRGLMFPQLHVAARVLRSEASSSE